MQTILSLLPKWFLALVVISAGIAFIIFSDPPHTVCKSQMEVFKKSQFSFLYLDPKSQHTKTTKFERLFAHCRDTNSPGGCLELFQLTKRFVDDLDAIPSECRPTLSGLSEIKKPLAMVTELLVRLAWRDKLPNSYHEKFGWLEIADISLFCKLKQKYTEFFGESGWNNFREKVMNDLPGAKDLTRTQVWDFSLLSENCARYP